MAYNPCFTYNMKSFLLCFNMYTDFSKNTTLCKSKDICSLFYLEVYQEMLIIVGNHATCLLCAVHTCVSLHLELSHVKV